jgi:2-oxoglutarate dehydrogenase E1 component
MHYRKPLIIFSPKRLLRHRLAVSSLEEIASGKVKRIINEVDDRVRANSENVSSVLFCSGQIYYDLLEERDRLWTEQDMSHTAIIRVEQLAPFPFDRAELTMSWYPNA